jgi:hypothetical protein
MQPPNLKKLFSAWGPESKESFNHACRQLGSGAFSTSLSASENKSKLIYFLMNYLDFNVKWLPIGCGLRGKGLITAPHRAQRRQRPANILKRQHKIKLRSKQAKASKYLKKAAQDQTEAKAARGQQIS